MIGTGAPVGSTVTNGAGEYVFSGLSPDTYTVGFPTTLPNGDVLVPANTGLNDNADSDAIADNGTHHGHHHRWW